MIKTMLIDDENKALDYLEYQLKNISGLDIVGKYINPLEGLKIMDQQKIDLVFLDIEMPSINGLELAKKMLEKNSSLSVVFITAYKKYAVKAYEINTIDYILKPVSYERLVKTLKRLNLAELEFPVIDSLNKLDMYVNLFGNIDFYKNIRSKKVKININWITAKTKELFLFMLNNRGKIINRSDLVKAIWPHLEQDKAIKQLYNSIYQIRSVLGIYNDNFTIMTELNGYKMIVKNVTIDVEEFEKIVNNKLIISDITLPDYEIALSLFTGNYLGENDYIWSDEEKQKYELMWLELAYTMVEYHQEKREFSKAITVSLKIIQLFPFEEDAHFNIMKSYHQLGRTTMIHTHYNKFKNLLTDKLGCEPDPEIKNWYDNLKTKSLSY